MHILETASDSAWLSVMWEGVGREGAGAAVHL